MKHFWLSLIFVRSLNDFGLVFRYVKRFVFFEELMILFNISSEYLKKDILKTLVINWKKPKNMSQA